MTVRRVSLLLSTCGMAAVIVAGMAAPASASVTATYSCNSAATGTQTFKASIHAVPSASSYKPGAKVSLTGFQVSLTLPASLVSLVESYGVTSVSGVVTNFSVAATNALPSTLNVAGKGFTVPTIVLPRPPKAVAGKFPVQAVTLSGWKAGAKAGTITFRTGPVTLNVKDNFGDSLPVSCTPSPAATIATAKLT